MKVTLGTVEDKYKVIEELTKLFNQLEGSIAEVTENKIFAPSQIRSLQYASNVLSKQIQWLTSSTKLQEASKIHSRKTRAKKENQS